jgi:hypothetical protein
MPQFILYTPRVFSQLLRDTAFFNNQTVQGDETNDLESETMVGKGGGAQRPVLHVNEPKNMCTQCTSSARAAKLH